TGTCEHCFNVAQAAKNLANMTAVGGYIIQAVPLNVYNHGFYNMSPTWIHDFYTENGFCIHYLKAISSALHLPKIYDVPPTKRFNRAVERSILLTVVERSCDAPIRWPIQSKYKAMLGSRAELVAPAKHPTADTIEFPPTALGYVSPHERYMR